LTCHYIIGNIVFGFHEYFYPILHDVNDFLHEFDDISQFVFLMQEFQKQHFVEEFDQIQLQINNNEQFNSQKIHTEINRILFII
jgi:hypothetical protein